MSKKKKAKIKCNKFTAITFVVSFVVCVLISLITFGCRNSPVQRFSIVNVEMTNGDTAVKSAENVAVEAIKANSEVIFVDEQSKD